MSDFIAPILQDFGFATTPAGSSGVTVVNPPGGTLNKIPKWSAATVLTDSNISDTGTAILLGVPTGVVVDTAAPLNNVATALTLEHTAPGGGQANNGVRLALDGLDTNGILSIAGTIDGVLTTATAAGEVSEIRFGTKSAGALALALTIASAAVTQNANDAATVTTTDVLALIHNTSGAAGVAFGSGIRWDLENSVGAAVNAARESVVWTDPVNATASSKFQFATRVAGAALANVIQFGAGVFVGAAADPGANNFAVSGTGLFTGAVTANAGVTDTVSDAATVTTTDVLTLLHKTSGAAGIAFGVGLLMQLQNSTGLTKNAARISTNWQDPVNATEDSQIVFERTIAGAAMTVGMTLRQGLSIGAGFLEPGTGNLIATGGSIYFGAALANGVLTYSANTAYLESVTASAATQVGLVPFSTAAATITRVIAWSYNITANAGQLFGVGDGAAYTEKWAIRFDGMMMNKVAANETATATGGAAAIPVLAQGFLSFVDSGGVVRKIPYFAL